MPSGGKFAMGKALANAPGGASRGLTVRRGAKRAQRACGRCRMRKTKCDGELPCRSCKSDGMICTVCARNKTRREKVPLAYAEILEKSQVVLIAIIHKLYSMVRSRELWDLGEPEANGWGQPTIHSIASKLGCIRPHDDNDLLNRLQFPENTVGMDGLARQLERHHKEHWHLDTGNMNDILSVDPDGMEAGVSINAAIDITIPTAFSTSGSSLNFDSGISSTSDSRVPSVANRYSCPPDAGSPDYLPIQFLQHQINWHPTEKGLDQVSPESAFSIVEPHALSWNGGPGVAINNPTLHSSHSQCDHRG